MAIVCIIQAINQNIAENKYFFSKYKYTAIKNNDIEIDCLKENNTCKAVIEKNIKNEKDLFELYLFINNTGPIKVIIRIIPLYI